MLCETAVRVLKDHGAMFHLGRKATYLMIDGQRLTGVRLEDGTVLSADRYIATLPHAALRALLSERLLTHYGYFQQLTHLVDSPKLTVQLTIGKPTSMPRLLLLTDRTFHHLVIHRHHKDATSTTGVMLVATGVAVVHQLTDDQALEESRKDLACVSPELAQAPILAHRIIRDQAACLSLRPGTRQWRPLPSGPIRNLFIGGAWTDTGWPSNLESAVVSGIRCAELAVEGGATA
jgi:phytoene dehydrogenase-like protein